MMNMNDLPEPLLASLDPIQVKQYARATGWVREPRTAARPLPSSLTPRRISTRSSCRCSAPRLDFSRRMGEVVSILAERERRPAGEILHDLLLPPADTLRFSESGSASESGDVPLDHGIGLLTGARKQLLAAACSELRPQLYHPRMSLAEAEQFLRQCRLGQTERGSFTVLVACPLNSVPEAANLIDQTPFTRRVTALLMRSLNRLSQALDADELDPLLHPGEGEPVLQRQPVRRTARHDA